MFDTVHSSRNCSLSHHSVMWLPSTCTTAICRYSILLAQARHKLSVPEKIHAQVTSTLMLLFTVWASFTAICISNTRTHGPWTLWLLLRWAARQQGHYVLAWRKWHGKPFGSTMPLGLKEITTVTCVSSVITVHTSNRCSHGDDRVGTRQQYIWI